MGPQAWAVCASAQMQTVVWFDDCVRSTRFRYFSINNAFRLILQTTNFRYGCWPTLIWHTHAHIYILQHAAAHGLCYVITSYSQNCPEFQFSAGFANSLIWMRIDFDRWILCCCCFFSRVLHFFLLRPDYLCYERVCVRFKTFGNVRFERWDYFWAVFYGRNITLRLMVESWTLNTSLK